MYLLRVHIANCIIVPRQVANTVEIHQILPTTPQYIDQRQDVHTSARACPWVRACPRARAYIITKAW